MRRVEKSGIIQQQHFRPYYRAEMLLLSFGGVRNRMRFFAKNMPRIDRGIFQRKDRLLKKSDYFILSS